MSVGNLAMSDLAAAAAAMGLPEVLVQRSAEARAADTGASVDDLLAAWAGGAPAPAAVSAEPVVGDAPTEEPAAPEVVIEVPAQAPAEVPDEVPAQAPAEAPVAALGSEERHGPYVPPVLVGSRDNPMTVLVGAVALFVLVALVGLVGPSLQAETPGALSTNLPYTQLAVDGQEIYGNLGCAACHTQMVRPVIADVGLGRVTLNDSNQILGTRRFGPDLSNVGSRVSATQLQATIEGQLNGHPKYTINPQDMSALVAYLSESVTVGEDG